MDKMGGPIALSQQKETTLEQRTAGQIPVSQMPISLEQALNYAQEHFVLLLAHPERFVEKPRPVTKNDVEVVNVIYLQVKLLIGNVYDIGGQLNHSLGSVSCQVTGYDRLVDMIKDQISKAEKVLSEDAEIY